MRRRLRELLCRWFGHREPAKKAAILTKMDGLFHCARCGELIIKLRKT